MIALLLAEPALQSQKIKTKFNYIIYRLTNY